MPPATACLCHGAEGGFAGDVLVDGGIGIRARFPGQRVPGGLSG